MTQAAISEFVYVSRYAQPTFGIITRHEGQITDPVANSVLVTMVDSEGQTFFEDRPCTRVEEGYYEVSLSSTETMTPGTYELQFEYVTGVDTSQTFSLAFEVGESAPAYDNLDPQARALVENVMYRFADLFDSPHGGPHLQVYFQSHFGRGRVAQLMGTALRRLNVISQPTNVYSLDSTGKEFPYDKFGGVLEQATYVEVLKHLIRSYVEQPDPRNVSVSYLDRRDYMNRWREVLRDEQSDLDKMLDTFKIAHLGLGRPSVLVDGGAFGKSWQYRSGMFMNPARPGYYIRYY